ncbi:MAG: HlyD family type I secretion periplasmic adaptor subunit [Limnohabitans sp.]
MGSELDMKKTPLVAVKSDVLTQELEMLEQASDTRSIARKGLWVLGLALGSFVLWAALAPLDEGVPAAATVSIDAKRKTIQHLSGGIIKEVLVHEGEHVQKGQLLVRMEEAVSRANYESVRQRYLGLSAMRARLNAEQTGASQLTFESDVLAAAKEDPLVEQQVTNQKQLFESRRASLRADMRAVDEALNSLRAQRAATVQVLAQRRQQLDLLKEELSNGRELVREGYMPRNRQMELERMVADIQAAVADQVGTLERHERSMSELNERREQRRAEYRKEVEAQLADVLREVQGDAQKFVAQKEDLERVELRAPVDGQVMGMTVFSAGTVIQPGQRLMDVVPKDQALLLEAQIPPHLIDSVEAGLLVKVRFSAFAHTPQLVVQGKVESVSGDLMVENTSPPHSYFLARVRLTPEGMKSLGAHQMQAGMQADMVIRTGQRSMLTYLIKPLLKGWSRALKEQ